MTKTQYFLILGLIIGWGVAWAATKINNYRKEKRKQHKTLVTTVTDLCWRMEEVEKVLRNAS